MRKLKLFTSVALSALLVACSNEDFIAEGQVAQTQESRPMAKVALTFDEGVFNEELTRASFDKGSARWTFTDGDKIGAILMDTWNGSGQSVEDFTFTDYTHTNYPFVRQTEGGVTTWNTPQDAAVEAGNYFFYFPYQKAFTYRGYVGWNVNPDQKNYNERGEYNPLQPLEDNQRWLGYRFIEATQDGINKLNFDFVPLFASPGFDIINKTGSKLKIEKLVLRDATNQNNQQIDIFGKGELMATTVMVAPSSGKFDLVNEKWESSEMDYNQHAANMWYHALRLPYANATNKPAYPTSPAGRGESLFIDNPSEPIYQLTESNLEAGALQEIAAASTYQYTVDFGDNYYVDALGHIQARLVMPGGVYRQQDNGQAFEALLFVSAPNTGDRYVVRIELGKAQTQGGTNSSAWDDINSSNAENFMKPGYLDVFQASFDASALQSYEITDFKVATTDQLKWVLEETAMTSRTDLLITTIGENVEMDKDIYKLLKSKRNYRLHVNGTIALAEDLDSDAINLLHFDEFTYNVNGAPVECDDYVTKLIIKGQQIKDVDTWADYNIAGQTNTDNTLDHCYIVVEEGGSLDTKTNNVSIVISNEVNTDYAGKVLDNRGTVVASSVTGDIVNSGTFTADNVEGEVSNTGTYTVLVSQKGNVTNNGEATIASANDVLENNGTMNLSGGTYANKVINNIGATMNINGASQFGFVAGDMNIDNQALNNHGELNINANATASQMQCRFYNDGTVKIADVKDGDEEIIVNFSYIRNFAGGVITVGKGATMITKTNVNGAVVNDAGATINNKGTLHKVNNNGTIVTGSGSFTDVTDGNGTIDNTAMGDVVYNSLQICYYKLADQAMSVEDLQDKVTRANANKLIVSKSTLNATGNVSLIGQKASGVTGFFAKGVEFSQVTVAGGGRLVINTDGMDIFDGKSTIDYDTELVVYKLSDSRTTLTIQENAELWISTEATLRGGVEASLILINNGKVHNAGTVTNLHSSSQNASAADPNHWTGKDAQ